MKIKNGMVLFWETADVFSNWHKSQFTYSYIASITEEPLTVTFNCSEQYMMWVKAILFNDRETATAILKEKSPREQKVLGRTVRGYDDVYWKACARELMVGGLMAKFTQNPDMRQQLLDTGDMILVEASPYDAVWGVGLSADDPRILDQRNWLGTNWLGEVLMIVRDRLRK